MVHAETPDHAPPALSIRLNQNPNAFFFPASTISGHVTYQNHYGNADYDLRLIFLGVNKVAAHDGPASLVDEATLFEYTFNLHTARKGSNHKLANSQVDTAPMSFPFKHRFPSATDNRSFSLMSHSNGNSVFSSHVHDLPPSFGAQSDHFQCSVEYRLRAELHYDQCLLCEYTLPIMFLPYSRPVRGKRVDSTVTSIPTLSFKKPLSIMRKDSFVSHLPDSGFNVGVELPTELTVGHPFVFEVNVQLPFRPTFEDEIPTVKVIALKMLSTTECRFGASALSMRSGMKEKYFKKAKTILLHPYGAESAATLDSSTNTVYYNFQASLSSYYTPSFRSFLISCTFTFESPLIISVDGIQMELDIASHSVDVLSPALQQTGARRVSTMAASSHRGESWTRSR